MQRHVRVVVAFGALVFCTFQHLARVRAPNVRVESRALSFVDQGRQDAAWALHNWKQRTEPWADKITTLAKERLSKTADQIKYGLFLSAEVRKQMQVAVATGASALTSAVRTYCNSARDAIGFAPKPSAVDADAHGQAAWSKAGSMVAISYFLGLPIFKGGGQQSSQASPEVQTQEPGSWSWWRIAWASFAVWLLLKVLNRRGARAASSRRVVDPATADDDESGGANSNAEKRRPSARAKLSPTAQFYLSSGLGVNPFGRRRSFVRTSTHSSTNHGGATRKAEDASSADKKDITSKGVPVVSTGLHGKPVVDDGPVATSKLIKSGKHSEAKSGISQKVAQTEAVVETTGKETNYIRTGHASKPASAGASSSRTNGKSSRSLYDFSFFDEEAAQDCLWASSVKFHRTNTSFTSTSTFYVDKEYAKTLAGR